MSNGYLLAKCASCQIEGMTIAVWELKPGARGNMAQSFTASYRLCPDCARRCEILKAIKFRAEPRATRGGMLRGSAYLIVYAKTLWVLEKIPEAKAS
jgi:hypothetical protein